MSGHRAGHPRGVREKTRAPIAALAVLLCWVLVGVAAGLLYLATGGQLQQVRAMSVLSGSMVPTLGVGDLVVAQVVPPTELQAGDIVTFRDPERDRYVTHRVQSIVWRGGLADIITRGDANEVGEQWTVKADGALGRVVLTFPGVGYALAGLGTVVGQIALGAVALLLAGWALHLIWRGGPQDDGAPASPAPRRARHRAGRTRLGSEVRVGAH